MGYGDVGESSLKVAFAFSAEVIPCTMQRQKLGQHLNLHVSPFLRQAVQRKRKERFISFGEVVLGLSWFSASPSDHSTGEGTPEIKHAYLLFCFNERTLAGLISYS